MRHSESHSGIGVGSFVIPPIAEPRKTGSLSLSLDEAIARLAGFDKAGDLMEAARENQKGTPKAGEH
jgi:hypothetical protein